MRYFSKVLLALLILNILSCSSIDYIEYESNSKNNSDIDEISLVTYNIKAIYDKEKDQMNNLMSFINLL